MTGHISASARGTRERPTPCHPAELGPQPSTARPAQRVCLRSETRAWARDATRGLSSRSASPFSPPLELGRNSQPKMCASRLPSQPEDAMAAELGEDNPLPTHHELGRGDVAAAVNVSARSNTSPRGKARLQSRRGHQPRPLSTRLRAPSREECARWDARALARVGRTADLKLHSSVKLRHDRLQWSGPSGATMPMQAGVPPRGRRDQGMRRPGCGACIHLRPPRITAGRGRAVGRGELEMKRREGEAWTARMVDPTIKAC
jgi:hypothetical protein